MMKTASNHSDVPLITVTIVAHEGDIKYFPRALESIEVQEMDPKQIQVILSCDGALSQEANRIVGKATEDYKFHSFLHLENARKTGYYCVPRNLALNHPYNFGFYQANLDVDNEWLPWHLPGLLKAIRLPQGDEGWPHFVYSRREYVLDEGVAPGSLPTGPSRFIEWTEDSVAKLAKAPKNNFIDTSDFLIGKGALYELAERTGCIWNPNMRRYGDWELMTRIAQAGLRGKAVDQVSHLYHWTGSNLQTTRKLSEFVVIPQDIYENIKGAGGIKDEAGL